MPSARRAAEEGGSVVSGSASLSVLIDRVRAAMTPGGLAAAGARVVEGGRRCAGEVVPAISSTILVMPE